MPQGNKRRREQDGAALTLSGQVVRRYLLGQQGLWPGRRWHRRAGTIAALRKLGAVQMDPLTIVARSYDLVLWSRVADYDPYRLNQRADLGAARALIARMLDKEQIVGIAVACATPVRASSRQRAGALRPFSSGQHGQFGRAANNLPRADPGRADNLKAQRRRTIAMPPAVAVAW